MFNSSGRNGVAPLIEFTDPFLWQLDGSGDIMPSILSGLGNAWELVSDELTPRDGGETYDSLWEIDGSEILPVE